MEVKKVVPPKCNICGNEYIPTHARPKTCTAPECNKKAQVIRVSQARLAKKQNPPLLK